MISLAVFICVCSTTVLPIIQGTQSVNTGCPNGIRPVPGDPTSYIQRVHTKLKKRQCAPGTRFNPSTCFCSILTDTLPYENTPIPPGELFITTTPNTQSNQKQNIQRKVSSGTKVTTFKTGIKTLFNLDEILKSNQNLISKLGNAEKSVSISKPLLRTSDQEKHGTNSGKHEFKTAKKNLQQKLPAATPQALMKGNPFEMSKLHNQLTKTQSKRNNLFNVSNTDNQHVKSKKKVLNTKLWPLTRRNNPPLSKTKLQDNISDRKDVGRNATGSSSSQGSSSAASPTKIQKEPSYLIQNVAHQGMRGKFGNLLNDITHQDSVLDPTNEGKTNLNGSTNSVVTYGSQNETFSTGPLTSVKASSSVKNKTDSIKGKNALLNSLLNSSVVKNVNKAAENKTLKPDNAHNENSAVKTSFISTSPLDMIISQSSTEILKRKKEKEIAISNTKFPVRSGAIERKVISLEFPSTNNETYKKGIVSVNSQKANTADPRTTEYNSEPYVTVGKGLGAVDFNTFSTTIASNILMEMVEPLPGTPKQVTEIPTEPKIKIIQKLQKPSKQISAKPLEPTISSYNSGSEILSSKPTAKQPPRTTTVNTVDDNMLRSPIDQKKEVRLTADAINFNKLQNTKRRLDFTVGSGLSAVDFKLLERQSAHSSPSESLQMLSDKKGNNINTGLNKKSSTANSVSGSVLSKPGPELYIHESNALSASLPKTPRKAQWMPNQNSKTSNDIINKKFGSNFAKYQMQFKTLNKDERLLQSTKTTNSPERKLQKQLRPWEQWSPAMQQMVMQRGQNKQSGTGSFESKFEQLLSNLRRRNNANGNNRNLNRSSKNILASNPFTSKKTNTVKNEQTVLMLGKKLNNMIQKQNKGGVQSVFNNMKHPTLQRVNKASYTPKKSLNKNQEWTSNDYLMAMKQFTSGSKNNNNNNNDNNKRQSPTMTTRTNTFDSKRNVFANVDTREHPLKVTTNMADQFFKKSRSKTNLRLLNLHGSLQKARKSVNALIANSKTTTRKQNPIIDPHINELKNVLGNKNINSQQLNSGGSNNHMNQLKPNSFSNPAVLENQMLRNVMGPNFFNSMPSLPNLQSITPLPILGRSMQGIATTEQAELSDVIERSMEGGSGPEGMNAHALNQQMMLMNMQSSGQNQLINGLQAKSRETNPYVTNQDFNSLFGISGQPSDLVNNRISGFGTANAATSGDNQIQPFLNKQNRFPNDIFGNLNANRQPFPRTENFRHTRNQNAARETSEQQKNRNLVNMFNGLFGSSNTAGSSIPKSNTASQTLLPERQNMQHNQKRPSNQNNRKQVNSAFDNLAASFSMPNLFGRLFSGRNV